VKRRTKHRFTRKL